MTLGSTVAEISRAYSIARVVPDCILEDAHGSRDYYQLSGENTITFMVSDGVVFGIALYPGHVLNEC